MKAWMKPVNKPLNTPTRTPIHGLPEKYEPTAAENALISIIPSSPMFKTPERSENIPPNAA
jgi:hypothetical protein